jgi:uncharacterized membrane protein
VTFPLIGPDQGFALWAALFGIAAFGFWCERYPFGRKYSGVMLLISLAIVLSNLRIIPSSAPVYDTVWNYLVPIAIPLLLFQADLRRVFREAGATLVAFIIGSATVVAGTIVAMSIIDLGPSEPELAGIFTGTYIGGSLNFAAVAEATKFRDETLLAATFAADNIITNLHLLVIIMLPGIAGFARLFPSRRQESAAPEAATQKSRHQVANLDVFGLVASLALAFALAATGKAIASAVGRPEYGILVITALALVVATNGRRLVANLSGFSEAGNVLMFIFLATIGASADIWKLIEFAPILFAVALIIVSVHLVLLLAIGRLFKLELGELLMGSAVCIGGPAIAPAIASAKGWSHLMVPGLLAGSFGYAIGSFVGMGVVEWLR